MVKVMARQVRGCLASTSWQSSFLKGAGGAEDGSGGKPRQSWVAHCAGPGAWCIPTGDGEQEGRRKAAVRGEVGLASGPSDRSELCERRMRPIVAGWCSIDPGSVAAAQVVLTVKSLTVALVPLLSAGEPSPLHTVPVVVNLWEMLAAGS